MTGHVPHKTYFLQVQIMASSNSTAVFTEQIEELCQALRGLQMQFEAMQQKNITLENQNNLLQNKIHFLESQNQLYQSVVEDLRERVKESQAAQQYWNREDADASVDQKRPRYN